MQTGTQLNPSGISDREYVLLLEQKEREEAAEREADEARNSPE